MNLIAAKHAGAIKIFITDFLDYNLEKAKKFGADYIINPSQKNTLERAKKYLRMVLIRLLSILPLDRFGKKL